MAVAESALGQVRRVWAREGVSALTLPLAETAIGCAVFMAALLVYNATLTPSLYVSLDGNQLATVPYQLGLAHSTGYPLYTWLGKLFAFHPHRRRRASHEPDVRRGRGRRLGAAVRGGAHGHPRRPAGQRP